MSDREVRAMQIVALEQRIALTKNQAIALRREIGAGDIDTRKLLAARNRLKAMEKQLTVCTETLRKLKNLHMDLDRRGASGSGLFNEEDDDNNSGEEK
jgi:mevalonate kinase